MLAYITILLLTFVGESGPAGDVQHEQQNVFLAGNSLTVCALLRMPDQAIHLL